MKLFSFLQRKEPAANISATPTKRDYGSFQITQAGRTTAAWYKPVLSANRELLYNLRQLRGISRWLANNDGYVARYLELLKINVSGPSGIQLQARITNSKTDEYASNVNAALEASWDDWCKIASIDGHTTFLDLEQLIIRTVAMDGECFFRKIWGAKVNEFGFALMMLDADLLDERYNDYRLGNGNVIVQGIEKNKWGQNIAYHFWSRSPDDLMSGETIERLRIPAEEVIHVFRPDRTSQARGKPWTTPAMYSLAKLHEYMDAEIVAAQAGAQQLGTIETPLNDITPYTTSATPASATDDVIALDYATFLKLAPGEKANTWTSGHPNTAFTPFVQTYLHSIASSLNVSYSSLASDTSQENYASGRISILTERDFYKNIQSWLIRQFHNNVFPEWLESAISRKALTLPTNDFTQYTNVMFRSRGWKWADPLKDLKAYETAIENNLISKTAICAEQGLDYLETLDDRYAERKLEAEHLKALVDAGLGPYLSATYTAEDTKVTLTEQESANDTLPANEQTVDPTLEETQNEQTKA